MSNTTAPATHLVRFVADYQMFGDMEGEPWTHLVFGHAKETGAIVDYKFLNSLRGAFGIQMVSFTVDALVSTDGMVDHNDLQEHGASFLSTIVGDSDVEVRWAAGIEGEQDA